ncbi:MAG: SDR family NAD(P)-dependent oxidoreductase [Acidobacteriota bacterium]|nr:SDR family NAD(P)-dependent oxidoreductase [Acidobacteriota bacterium]
MNTSVSVVTGATSGIGLEAACGLARAGTTVVVVSRTRERGEAACRRIAAAGGTGLLEIADLSSLAQVRALADRLGRRFEAIHLLVNDAGLYCHDLERSADGFELTMAVNHLAPFVLTNRLLPALRAGRARVVNVASDAHRAARLRRAPLDQILRGEAPDFRFRGVVAYCDSKLANILFTTELHRREQAHGLTALAVHPGAVATRLWNRNQDLLSRIVRLAKPFMLSSARSGAIIARLATDTALAGSGGAYFHKARPVTPSTDAQDAALAEELWRVSTEVTDAV